MYYLLAKYKIYTISFFDTNLIISCPKIAPNNEPMYGNSIPSD